MFDQDHDFDFDFDIDIDIDIDIDFEVDSLERRQDFTTGRPDDVTPPG